MGEEKIFMSDKMKFNIRDVIDLKARAAQITEDIAAFDGAATAEDYSRVLETLRKKSEDLAYKAQDRLD
jgi:hypothetical protein